MEGRMGTMGDEPIERPEREEARSGEAERAVKEVGSAKSARDADAAGKEGAEPYKPGSFEGGIVEFPSGDEPAVPPRKRLPLVLAIIGLVLCFTGSLALVGAACGAVSLGLFVRDRKATEGSPALAAPKATLGLAACSLLLGITIMAGMASGDDAQVQQPDQPASQQQEALLEAAEEHELSFVVEAAGEEDAPASVTVLVTGTQADGTKVSDSHRAALGKTYVLAYPAGSYTFEVSASSLEAGDVLFKAERVECAFDGSADRTVRIKVSQDAAAMQKAQEEKAAQEKAAQEEAERQRAEEAAAAEAAAAAAAEQEAAAAAAAEQEAAAAAAAAAAASGGGGDTVYITNTGEKYHRDGCRYLKKSQIAISRSDAIAQGYGACSVCNP